jgi:F plasmid transfer operon, TraF, protein
MWMKFPALVVGVCLALPASGIAQTLDHLGDRASAMGAFVAVADDASAVLWNPAGLVNGPIFNIAWDFGRTTLRPDDDLLTATQPAAEEGVTFLAAALPPLGFSFFRGRQTLLSPAENGSAIRQDRQVGVRTLVTSQLGVTVLHSVAGSVTVGATAKLLRGSLVTGSARLREWDEGFDRADRLDGDERTTGDVDVGAIASVGRARVGVVARNLATPTFRSNTESHEVARHVRVGAAWGDRWPGITRWIVSVDADLTRVPQAMGERRDIAAGVERWFRRQTLAVRGGFRASTAGDLRPVASAGASYAMRNGIYVDGYAARGRDADGRWGIAGRLTF